MSPTNPQNRLLDRLSKKTYQLLRPMLEPYVLNYAEIIYEPGAKISHI